MVPLPLLPLLVAAGGDVTELPPLVAARSMSGVSDNRQLIWLNDTEGEPARCLDGSPYAFYIWPGNSSDWSMFIAGGGWCLTEEECDVRAGTALGSSLGYNITGAWGPPPYNRNGVEPAYTCQGQDPNCTRVYMPYCDGSCFTSQRVDPWAVPGTNHSLHLRGYANLRRTLDVLQTRFGLDRARRFQLTGGSAGGLSTFLHLDYVANRLRKAVHVVATSTHEQGAVADSTATATAGGPRAGSPTVQPPLQVVGRPVAGFFIDGPSYNA
eukprot:Hpha_TRINITY_DN30814_c0_g1::TRINITY_DN30814_c0_g1_i1::g.155721::m.155721/K19882/NOTUM; O-palmitoleoyl-L-serine hydrolase